MLPGNDSGAGDGQWVDSETAGGGHSRAGGRETQGTDGQNGPRGWQGRGMDVGALSETKKPEEQLPGHLEGRGASFLRGGRSLGDVSARRPSAPPAPSAGGAESVRSPSSASGRPWAVLSGSHAQFGAAAVGGGGGWCP